MRQAKFWQGFSPEQRTLASPSAQRSTSGYVTCGDAFRNRLRGAVARLPTHSSQRPGRRRCRVAVASDLVDLPSSLPSAAMTLQPTSIISHDTGSLIGLRTRRFLPRPRGASDRISSSFSTSALCLPSERPEREAQPKSALANSGLASSPDRLDLDRSEQLHYAVAHERREGRMLTGSSRRSRQRTLDLFEGPASADTRPFAMSCKSRV
jgi:hypothetical protein